LAEIRAEKGERLPIVPPFQRRKPLHRLLLEDVASDRVVRVGRIRHDPAALEQRRRPLDMPRLRIPRIDRLDGRTLPHPAMLRPPVPEGKKSNLGTPLGDTFAKVSPEGVPKPIPDPLLFALALQVPHLVEPAA